MGEVRSIALAEYQPRQVSTAELPEEDARTLHAVHGTRVDVRRPLLGPGLELESKRWVGAIPIGPDLTLELKPRVSLGNLFGMLEYAYDLKGFHVLPGSVRWSP